MRLKVALVVGVVAVSALPAAFAAGAVREPASAARHTPDAPARDAGDVTGADLVDAAFEPNVGQLPAEVKFAARLGSGWAVGITAGGLVWSRQPARQARSALATLGRPPSASPSVATPLQGSAPPRPTSAHASPESVGLSFVHSRPDVTISGATRQRGYLNYLKGRDRSGWHSHVPLWGSVVYQQLWPGIDLRYDTRPTGVKGTYVIAPGSDPSLISWRYPGAALSLDRDHNLVISAKNGTVLTERAPVAWQARGAERVPVPAHFALGSDGTVGFRLGAHSSSLPLFIDPTIEFTTIFGPLGGGAAVMGVATDDDGNVYAAGGEVGYLFPSTPAPQVEVQFPDAFVTKLSADGRHLLWSTIIGGTGQDEATAISLNAQRQPALAGLTCSPDFPVTTTAAQPVNAGPVSDCGGMEDAFVLKLDAAGLLPIFSTFWGGCSYEYPGAVAQDRSGDVFVVGGVMLAGAVCEGQRVGVRTTAGAYQPAREPDCACSFLTRFSSGGALVFSTYLDNASVGCPPEDEPLLRGSIALAVGIGADDTVYVGGWTRQPNLRTTPGALQRLHHGRAGGLPCHIAGYVAAVRSGGRAAPWVTYLGGVQDYVGAHFSMVTALDTDTAGAVYVGGSTSTPDFPTTSGAAQQRFRDGSYHFGADAFVAKFNPAHRLVWSTFVGGRGDDVLSDIVVMPDRSVLAVGLTTSMDFPQRLPLQRHWRGLDGFVVRVSPTGARFSFSSYFGGFDTFVGQVAKLPNGNAIVGGQTCSRSFPAQPTAEQPYYTNDVISVFDGVTGLLSVGPISFHRTCPGFVSKISFPRESR
jgi:hypothetical protein